MHLRSRKVSFPQNLLLTLKLQQFAVDKSGKFQITNWGKKITKRATWVINRGSFGIKIRGKKYYKLVMHSISIIQTLSYYSIYTRLKKNILNIIYWNNRIIIVIQKKNKFTKKYSLSVYKFFPWLYHTMTFNIKGLFRYCSFKSDIVISSKHLQSTVHKAEKSDPDRTSKT